VTEIQDCPIAGEPTATGATCPTTLADATLATCIGSPYVTEVARDGAGYQRGITAHDPSAEGTGASVASIAATASYGADLVKYDFHIDGTATSAGRSVQADTRWTKDLRGSVLGSEVTVDGASSSTFASSALTFDELGNQLAQINALSPELTEVLTYTPTRNIASRTDFAGTEFRSFYDGMDRLVRHCYADGQGGFEGERLTRDALTGAVTSVVHFENPNGCDACTSGDCGDVDTDMVAFTYTPFGAVLTKVYLEGLDSGSPRATALSWGYDEYQRPVCFADAVATIMGNTCPTSPVPPDWTPTPEEQLASFVYWEDDDAYRRGLLKSACRGVARQENGELVYETQCLDQDYYTSVDTEGSCEGVPATGAYASLLETSTLCSGGSCLTGEGEVVYASRHQYDAHRRDCAVTTRDAEDRIILDSRYAYDQYDNVVTETHASDLDPSDASNYSLAYTYDGLLRLIGSDRTDAEGDPIESYRYEYDAASNITQKVKTTYE
jgi:hypothetical protein